MFYCSHLLARFTDPTYTVEFEYGRGLKLLGNINCSNTVNNIDGKGFLGHVANSIHPLHDLPTQNARFDLKRKFSTRRNDSKINKSLFAVGDLGYFPLVACRDIASAIYSSRRSNIMYSTIMRIFKYKNQYYVQYNQIIHNRRKCKSS